MNIKFGLLIFVIAFSLSGCSNNIKNNGDGANLKQASATNLQLGIGYLRRGQYEVAQKKLLKSIKQDPDNIVAYTTMAYLMMQLNKMDKAEDYYLDALDINYNDPELSNSYGTYLCRVGRVSDAMEQFKKAYEDPFYKTAYLSYANAGTCLLQAGKYKFSEKMLRQALKFQPRLSGALISMAELSVRTKKFMSARAYIQRYHAINKPSAESLWVQVQAERALGAKKHYYKYARQILDEFPDSKQAGLVEGLWHRDKNK